MSWLHDHARLLLAADVVLVGLGPTVLGADEHVHVDQGAQGNAHVDVVGLEVRQRHEDARSDGDRDRRPRVGVHRRDRVLQRLADLGDQAQRCLQGEPPRRRDWRRLCWDGLRRGGRFARRRGRRPEVECALRVRWWHGWFSLPGDVLRRRPRRRRGGPRAGCPCLWRRQRGGRWRRHIRDVGVRGARGAGWGSGHARNQRLCEGIDRPRLPRQQDVGRHQADRFERRRTPGGQDAPARLTFGRCDEHPGSGEDLDDRLRRLGDATKLVVFEHLADLGGSVGPDDEEPLSAEPDPRALGVGRPGWMGRNEVADRIQQVALDVRAKDRPAVSMRTGREVAVDDERCRPLDEFDQDALLVQQRNAGHRGEHLRHHDVVGFGQMLHRLRRHDVGKCEQAQAAAIRRIGDPAHDEATRLAAFEPNRQGHQVGGPFVALLISDRGMAERAVQFAAQPGEEGRLSPARLEFLAHGDGGPAGDDVRVSALQGEEGHLQAKPKEPAGRAEEVVGCRGQQVDVRSVAADRRDDVAVEGLGVAAVAVLEALEEFALGRDQLVDR
nr:hypothetical protein FIAIKCIJ_00001 [uncultured bacterium]